MGYTKPREIKSQLFEQYEPRFPDQKGRVIAITGTTSGTGFIAARTALKKGAHVILLNRASSRATAAEAQLAAEVPGAADEGRITAIECDLQNFENVRSAAAKVCKQFEETGIDVLINNAGVMALKDEATTDGYDVQIQTNHLSHFLLTKDLYPLLKTAAEKRGQARVVNHSSIARNGKKLQAKYFGKNGGALGGNGSSMFCGGARWVRYHMTKLANVVFTLGLHDRLQAKGVNNIKAVCCAPGLASTQLQVTTAADGGFGSAWIMKYGQSAEDGTLPLLISALDLSAEGADPAVTMESGDFIEPSASFGFKGKPKKKVITKEKECADPAGRTMLWEESEKACGEFSF
eukprot:TRINITY_DN51914_c0_g1_i1.p1 TRINITY_DN51914_c0_g1~~TRINITY_DN51914_c0_g1_i1.p1  ORF type:complete len:348 (+),score=99.99 TRINITY_DN51914_c0_g1_i1:105-1148(+)